MLKADVIVLLPLEDQAPNGVGLNQQGPSTTEDALHWTMALPLAVTVLEMFMVWWCQNAIRIMAEVPLELQNVMILRLI